MRFSALSIYPTLIYNNFKNSIYIMIHTMDTAGMSSSYIRGQALIAIITFERYTTRPKQQVDKHIN